MRYYRNGERHVLPPRLALLLACLPKPDPTYALARPPSRLPLRAARFHRPLLSPTCPGVCPAHSPPLPRQQHPPARGLCLLYERLLSEGRRQAAPPRHTVTPSGWQSAGANPTSLLQVGTRSLGCALTPSPPCAPLALRTPSSQYGHDPAKAGTAAALC